MSDTGYKSMAEPGMHRHAANRRWGVLGAAAWLWLMAGWVMGSTMELRLAHTNLSVGQTVELQLVFENGAPRSVPRIEVAGLTIQYLGPSQVMQVINGQAINQLILNYQLTAQRPGQYVIPALQVPVGNQILSTEPVALSVGEMDKTVLAQQAFFKLHLPRTNLYVGEVAVVTVDLYAVAEQSGTPEWVTAGFTPGPWVAQRPQVVNLGGRNFALHRYQTYVLANQAGRLELGPLRFMARLPAPNARRSLFFNEILDWRNVLITNAPLPVTVRPLPTAGAPPWFAGAIGALKMQVSVSPTNVAVGDPITVKIELSGEQLLLDTLRLPEQPAWSQFKVYPPVSRLENANALGLGGRKIFEQVVVPQSTETKILPPFHFSFFDPQTGQYQTLSGPEVALVVRPSASATTFIPATETNTIALVAIKPHPGTLASASPPLVTQPWFWGLQLAPVALYAGLWWRRRRLDTLAANPRLRRRRDTDRWITRGLEELQRLGQKAEAEAFFAMVFRLLQERLGERLDLPASSITEAVIEERLKPAGVDAQLLEELNALFQICNQARYAPRHAAFDFADIAARTTAVLQKLERLELKEGGL